MLNNYVVFYDRGNMVTLLTLQTLYPPRQSIKQIEITDLVKMLTNLSNEPQFIHWFSNVQYMCELVTEYLLRGYLQASRLRQDTSSKISTIV